MARPKLGDTETERMQLKITAAEIQAIDDWRFSNRIPSRSEAMRRLCAAAIVALNGLDKVGTMAEDASISALDDYEYVSGLLRGLLEDAAEGKKRGFSHEEAINLLNDLSDRAYWQEQNNRYINRILSGFNEAVNMYAQQQAFSSAERQAIERLEQLDAFIDIQHRGWDEMEDHHVRSSVFRSMTDAERSELSSIEDHEKRIRYIEERVNKIKANRRINYRRLKKKIRREDELIRQKYGIQSRQQNLDETLPNSKVD